MKMSNELYDTLKRIVTIILPALATLYVTLAKIWGFPYSAEVAGTITGLCTFLGACLQISNNNYRKENATTEE